MKTDHEIQVELARELCKLDGNDPDGWYDELNNGALFKRNSWESYMEKALKCQIVQKKIVYSFQSNTEIGQSDKQK